MRELVEQNEHGEKERPHPYANMVSVPLTSCAYTDLNDRGAWKLLRLRIHSATEQFMNSNGWTKGGAPELWLGVEEKRILERSVNVGLLGPWVIDPKTIGKPPMLDGMEVKAMLEPGVRVGHTFKSKV